MPAGTFLSRESLKWLPASPLCWWSPEGRTLSPCSTDTLPDSHEGLLSKAAGGRLQVQAKEVLEAAFESLERVYFCYWKNKKLQSRFKSQLWVWFWLFDGGLFLNAVTLGTSFTADMKWNEIKKICKGGISVVPSAWVCVSPLIPSLADPKQNNRVENAEGQLIL